MKISFDYDGVLTQAIYQSEAKKMIAAGYNVCIVTSRADQDPQVLATAEMMGIKEVHFTDDKPKVLNAILADAHFDDSKEVIAAIGKSCKMTTGVHAKRAKRAYAERSMERVSRRE